MLDNGAGAQEFHDDEHELRVFGKVVLGKGSNQFGKFISIGRLWDEDTTVPQVLVLARRYLASNDMRGKWDWTEFADHALSLSLSGKRNDTPWCVAALDSRWKKKKKNKRKRED